MASPSVFISYSHKDEIWKDRLVTHLGVLEQAGILDLWEDRRIEGGDDWYPEIENAINKATVAILMISANFLTSKFILSEEVPKLLERREKEGVRVIPVIVKPCAWTQVKWLSKIQARPKDGKPLSSGNENQIDTDLAALANEIASILRRAETSEAPKSGETSKVWKLPPDKVSTAKLPSTDPILFGRELELIALDDAWNNQQINVISLVAWGGVGKTALVNKWLLQMAKNNYRGAERVYGWSFYSQGSSEGRQVSSDQFIAAALDWFGDPDVTKGSPWDKGERLAELIKHQRTLLILDGLEPLQNPPPVETGKIKDPGLSSLLRELARQNPGLVVISTRLAVNDLKDFIIRPLQVGRDEVGSVLEIDLENLSIEAGTKYLEYLGIKGLSDELEKAVTEFGGHPLALTLLGRYLADIYDGDIRKRDLIPKLTEEEEKGGQAKRIMDAYEKWFEDKPEREILYLLGLFDRPAQKGAMDALLSAPLIEGLTNKLQGLSIEKYKLVLKHLRQARLLGDQDSHEPETLDCHPLLREHFGEKLKAENLSAWRKAHGRLYEYYKTTAKELPETLEEMAPLHAALIHCCQAGQHQDALNMFWERIARGEEFFFTEKLGAISSTLAMFSNFFDQPWHKFVNTIPEDSKGFILNVVGGHLRGLGRLAEAVQPMLIGLEIRIGQENWRGASLDAKSISELYLTIGDLTKAMDYASQSVDFAYSSNDWERSRTCIAALADTLHQTGNLLEAESWFQEIEAIQETNQPEYPFLYSLWGFLYCDFLLSLNRIEEVLNRANQILELGKLFHFPLDIAFGNLLIGRSLILQSHQKLDNSFTESVSYMNQAVDAFRLAGRQDTLPRGLLARAELYRLIDAPDKAQKDLDEAFSISTRGGMGLHLADCHLEYARLYLAKGDKEKTREHWEIAKDSIEKMGYHRRDKEVEALEEQLK